MAITKSQSSSRQQEEKNGLCIMSSLLFVNTEWCNRQELLDLSVEVKAWDIAARIPWLDHSYILVISSSLTFIIVCFYTHAHIKHINTNTAKHSSGRKAPTQLYYQQINILLYY